MRKSIASFAFISAVVGSVLGVSSSASADCSYKGDSNALPTSGLPVLVYANGDTTPAGFIGISDGSGDNYGQISGGPSGVQIEGKSSDAGQSGWAKSDGAMGAC